MPKTPKLKKSPKRDKVVITDPYIIKTAGMIAHASRKTTERVIEELLSDYLKRSSENILAQEWAIEYEYLSGEMCDKLYRLRRGMPPPKDLIEEKKQRLPQITAQRYIAGEITDHQFKTKLGSNPTDSLKDQKLANEMLNCWIETQARQAGALPEPYVTKLADLAIHGWSRRG